MKSQPWTPSADPRAVIDGLAGAWPGEERRSGLRVPVEEPVRVGPPGGVVSARVSARDLSVRGLLVDADRPVQVGVRFSAEIPLSSGEKVYVREAEVAYNRPDGKGFGVRFVDLDEEAVRCIEAEVTSRGSEPEADAFASDAPTLPPLEPRGRDANGAGHRAGVRYPPSRARLEVSAFPPEPVLVEDALSLHPPPAPSIARRSRALGLSDALSRARRRFLERARHRPRLWIAIGCAGALCLTAGLVASFAASGEVARAPSVGAPPEAGLDPMTHQVLMGERDPASLAPPPSPTASSERIEATQPVSAIASPRPAEAERGERADRALSPEARALLGGTESVAVVLEPGATVLRTHVLHAPPRFVIDLVGQVAAPILPAPRGSIAKIRFGRHPEHARLVIDASRKLATGRVSKDGDRMRVTLHFE